MNNSIPHVLKTIEWTIADIGREVGISGMIDIGLMSILIYAALVLFRKSRAASVAHGILIMGAVYLGAHQFDLSLTTSILEAFFAVLLVAMIVIFRDEVRRFFENVASWGTNRIGTAEAAKRHTENEMLVRLVDEFARERIGALIVLRGRAALETSINGGVLLDGYLSETLLKSIFDKHSEGHDGALIIDGGRISRFGAHLPLSNDFVSLRGRGTRHAAALGLAEISDALSIVVSEERGKISVAHDGELRNVKDSAELSKILDEFTARLRPTAFYSWRAFTRQGYRLKVSAVAISLLLWFVMVYASKHTQRNFLVPVEYTDLPRHLELRSIEPHEVTLRFSGARRSFYLVNEDNLRVVVSLSDAAPGQHAILLSEMDVLAPRDLAVRSFHPSKINLDIAEVK